MAISPKPDKFVMIQNSLWLDTRWGKLSTDMRLYMLLNDMVTSAVELEDGTVCGAVYSGKPVSYQELGAVLKLSWPGVQKIVQRLVDHGFVRVERDGPTASYSYFIPDCLKIRDQKAKKQKKQPEPEDDPNVQMVRGYFEAEDGISL